MSTVHRTTVGPQNGSGSSGTSPGRRDVCPADASEGSERGGEDPLWGSEVRGGAGVRADQAREKAETVPAEGVREGAGRVDALVVDPQPPEAVPGPGRVRSKNGWRRGRGEGNAFLSTDSSQPSPLKCELGYTLLVAGNRPADVRWRVLWQTRARPSSRSPALRLLRVGVGLLLESE